MTLPDLLIQSPDNDHLLPTDDSLNLKRFLYIGGAECKSTFVYDLIEDGKLGTPQLDRIDLLIAIKNELNYRLSKGDSARSVPAYLFILKQYFEYCDSNSLTGDLDNLVDHYLEYSEHLFTRAAISGKASKMRSAYTTAGTLSSLFGKILEIPEAQRLIGRTRIVIPTTPKNGVSKTADKQNLENTFTQGRFLVSLIQGLTVDAILGWLPLKVEISPGIVNGDSIELSAGLEVANWIDTPQEDWSVGKKSHYREILRRRQPRKDVYGEWAAKRWMLVNLRVEAEFLVFLAQTGMNLTQAKELRKGDLKYKALNDDWLVRVYKNRKGGEVSFRIYKSYKPFLDSFRKFTNHFFPDSEYFFPIFGLNGGSESITRSSFKAYPNLKKLIALYELPWVPPSLIRNTRINYILRRTGDANLTAEMAQHTVQVLREKYEQPSQQRSMVEITQFWNKHDPIGKPELKSSVIGSNCNGQPKQSIDKPDSAPSPNCVSPSGCLWCQHHRDIDSQDYVWSLFSFRHLKNIETSLTLSREKIPADCVVERVSEKIEWFKQSSSLRAQWVSEALQRIEERDFHPDWAHLIYLAE